jgi:hypothetical protein
MRDLIYDTNGNLIEERYFDEVGVCVKNKDNTGIWRLSYNKTGFLIEEEHFDCQNKRVLNNNKYHRYLAEYNNNGYITSASYYDINLEPTNHRTGEFRWEVKYDESNGNMIEQWYFDKSKNLTYGCRSGLFSPKHEGVAGWTAKYDKNNNFEEERYFDTKKKPRKNAEGCFVSKYFYVKNKLVKTECRTSDEAGSNLINNVRGFAVQEMHHDELGNIKHNIYRDEKGQMIQDNGFVKSETILYTNDGEIETREKFTSNGNEKNTP